MKTYWGSGSIAPCTLHLLTRQRGVVSFTSRRLYLGVRTLGTHWRGGWVGPRDGIDAVVKGKIPSLPLPGNERRSSIP